MAATTTEYAIVVVLIAAGLILATDAVRMATDGALRRTSAALAPTAPAAAVPASDPVPASSPALAALPLVHFAAWLVLAVAVAFVAFARYQRQRALRTLQERHCGAEPAPEEPSHPNFRKRQQIQRVLLKHFDAALQSQIEVRHVMSRTVRTVAPTTDMFVLREVMEQEGFRHLLVMQHDKLLGVISDRDIKSRSGRLAQNVMTANPLTISPATQLSHATTMMLHRQISCLPVVDAGEVQGILTTTDLLTTLYRVLNWLDAAS